MVKYNFDLLTPLVISCDVIKIWYRFFMVNPLHTDNAPISLKSILLDDIWTQVYFYFQISFNMMTGFGPVRQNSKIRLSLSHCPHLIEK